MLKCFELSNVSLDQHLHTDGTRLLFITGTIIGQRFHKIVS